MNVAVFACFRFPSSLIILTGLSASFSLLPTSMVNFSSLIPKTPLKRAVLGLDGALTAPLAHLAAERKPALGGKYCRGHEIHGEPGPFSHSNGTRKHAAISNTWELTGPFRHLLAVSQSHKSGFFGFQTMSYQFVAEAHLPTKSATKSEDKQAVANIPKNDNDDASRKHQIGENIPKKDKIKFLVNTLLDIKDSKEAIYGALDAWVAWECNFPIASLKRVIAILEKEHQWHRVIQVIKWMLSKGQGNTMGTYGQFIRALDMDHRAEEAHSFWKKKIGKDLHSVPWQLCRQMIAIYYRNNMLEELIKLFKGLEGFDREPPEKSIVQKVADAYEMLGRLQEKERVLAKYSNLFNKSGMDKKSRRASSDNKKRSGQKKPKSDSDDPSDTAESVLQQDQS